MSSDSTSARGHVRAVTPLLLLSLLGILASAAFQLVIIRHLGPGEFGILAAYLALINVASIGSSAVRNSVAVGVARVDLRRHSVKDHTLWESALYGMFFAIGVGVLLLSQTHSASLAGWLVLIAIVPYFIFARAQGLMQGDHHITRVMVWSTGAQILQFVLALIAIVFGADWRGVLLAMTCVAVLGAVFSSYDVRRLGLVSSAKPFASVTVRALLITVAFTWLISMDVSWVRAFGSSTSAGLYGAAATIVKMGFLVPTTLALYLLPRFARNISDRSFQAKALMWSAAAATVSGAVFALLLWAFPAALIALFGSSYAGVGAIAPAIAIAFLPWVVAQSVVTQMTAQASLGAIAVLILASVTQVFLAMWTLPDLNTWIVAQGLLGLAVLGTLVLIFLRSRSRPQPA